MNIIDFVLDSSTIAVVLKILIGALLFCFIGTFVIFCCVFRNRKSDQRSDIENQSEIVVIVNDKNLLHTRMIEELKTRMGNRIKFVEEF